MVLIPDPDPAAEMTWGERAKSAEAALDAARAEAETKGVALDALRA